MKEFLQFGPGRNTAQYAGKPLRSHSLGGDAEVLVYPKVNCREPVVYNLRAPSRDPSYSSAILDLFKPLPKCPYTNLATFLGTSDYGKRETLRGKI